MIQLLLKAQQGKTCQNRQCLITCDYKDTLYSQHHPGLSTDLPQVSSSLYHHLRSNFLEPRRVSSNPGRSSGSSCVAAANSRCCCREMASLCWKRGNAAIRNRATSLYGTSSSVRLSRFFTCTTLHRSNHPSSHFCSPLFDPCTLPGMHLFPRLCVPLHNAHFE